MKAKPAKTPTTKKTTPEPVAPQRRKVMHIDGRGKRRMKFEDEVTR